MIKKEWKIEESASSDFLRNEKYSRVILQLLYNRGIKTENDIDSFMNPNLDEEIHDPFLFRQMREAVDLIIKHIKSQSLITIYGDYDVDGITSSALLANLIKTLHGKSNVYIPDRKSEGYGIHKESIDKIIENGTKLIISVDCGIRNFEEVEYAKEKGIDIIITDHHTPDADEKKLPKTILINPKTPGETYPYKHLAGVGVAFKLSQALISEAKIEDELKKRLEERNMDLLAIGTVADCVELSGENRALLKKGINVLDSTNKFGLKEIFKIAKINLDKKIESWNIGFQIAPRLNAAGRLGHAYEAYELLSTESKDEARKIAFSLNEKNIERQEVTENIIKHVEEKINPDDKVIICVSPSDWTWEEGVIGLVAGRITEKYYRPSLVITNTDDGFKGSGRSINELNIVEVLSKCGDSVDKYGGHAKACGFSIKKDRIEDFKIAVQKEVSSVLEGVDLRPVVKIETELSFYEISEKLVDDLASFAPFGEGNPNPNFVSRKIMVMDLIKLGQKKQHLKLKLRDDNRIFLDAIGFWQVEKWDGLEAGDLIDIVYSLERNEFNGRVSQQLRIVDIRILER